MHELLSTVNSVYRALRLRQKRARERELLLTKTDWVLKDIGISRTLLKEGIKAWPWRELEEIGQRRVQPTDMASAIAELKGYSDRELADLGVSRHGIREAVEHGRPDHEADERRAA